MIQYATVVRLSDGIPLSASTDVNNDLSDAKSKIKQLTVILSQQPKRTCLQEDNYTIQ